MHTNIVLMSDGTGNSSSTPFKTNVWRLYQAVDIAPPLPETGKPRQIVYYDSGVGTENFKPLAALGGALGIGVWKTSRTSTPSLVAIMRPATRFTVSGSAAAPSPSAC